MMLFFMQRFSSALCVVLIVVGGVSSAKSKVYRIRSVAYAAVDVAVWPSRCRDRWRCYRHLSPRSVSRPASEGTPSAAFLSPLETNKNCENIGQNSTIVTGFTVNGVTQRCIRRTGAGVMLACDSGEMAVTVFCDQNSTQGVASALVSSGVINRRTAACLWSAGGTDGTIVVGCKLVGSIRNDSSGSDYDKNQTPME